MKTLKPARLSLLLLALLSCGGTAPREAQPTRPYPLLPTAVEVAAVAPEPPREDASLLSRRTLFADADRMSPSVSPDGKRLAFIGREGGVQNLFTSDIDAKNEARAITRNSSRGVQSFAWVGAGDELVYFEDTSGAGDVRASVLPTEGGEPVALNPAGSRARLLGTSARRPGEVLLLVNDRDPNRFDVQHFDTRTQQTKLLLKNELGFADFVADEALSVRLAKKNRSDGGFSFVVVGSGEPETWPELASFDLTEAGSSRAVGFDASGRKLLLIDNRGRADTALVSVDLRTKKSQVIAEGKGADISSVLFEPRRGVMAFATVADRREWKGLEKGVSADLATIAQLAEGDIDIISRSDRDDVSIVAVRRPESPTRFFRFFRTGDRRLGLLFSSNRLLETTHLQATSSLWFRARDGLELQAYLTEPPNASSGVRVPLVLWVHGGPWAREAWAMNPYHQLFASRGYAALSVNYRGSRGFGKAFLNAGNREWGGKMQEDLADAVAWAVARGVIDEDRIAIGGVDYGGYAALMGLALTPGLFKCGIDIGGPTDLVALLEDSPPHWAPLLAELNERIGDPTNAADRERLRTTSPFGHTAAFQHPLLVIEGGNDPRPSQATELVATLHARGIGVTHVVFPDEGLSIERPENRIASASVIDAFLAQCLGGRYEPYGRDFRGSSIEVKTGVARIARLTEGLAER